MNPDDQPPEPLKADSPRGGVGDLVALALIGFALMGYGLFRDLETWSALQITATVIGGVMAGGALVGVAVMLIRR